MLEKTLESPWDSKEIQPVNPKRNQSWIFIGGTDVEAETPILWPPNARNWLIRKHSDAGKVWRWEEKGTTEDEMVGWYHQLDGHEFEQALGFDDEQGLCLICCSPWGHKESDVTERLNWTDCIRHAGKLKHYGYRCLIFLIPPVVHNNNNDNTYSNTRASQVALVVKNPPANAGHIRDWDWPLRIRSLPQEDLLETGMATYSSILAWRIPMDRGAWRATVHAVAKSRTQLKRLLHWNTWIHVHVFSVQFSHW